MPPRPFQLSRRAGLSSDQPIGRLMAQALAYPELVSLAAGFVDNATLPVAATQAAMERLGSSATSLRRSLQYDASAGSLQLRDKLAQWSYRDWPGLNVPAERLILTAGSNQFLHLLADALLDPGDIVLAAAPTYFVFMGTLKGAGARVVGITADADGMCIDSLESELERLAAQGQADRVKAIYLVTDFDNPSGSSLSLERRERLLEIVRRWRAEHGPLLILSDNAYTELRYSGDPLPPLLALSDDTQHFVVEAGTFSKSYSPGVRVGWGVVPEPLVQPLLSLKSSIDFGSPHFSQVLMHGVLDSGALDEHLPLIRSSYQAKLQAMLDALQDCLGTQPGVSWCQPEGGLYVWLQLPEFMDAAEGGELWRRAIEAGVLYVPGHYCYPSEGCPVAKNTIRLSFGVQDAAGIRTGIERLAAAIQAVADLA